MAFRTMKAVLKLLGVKRLRGPMVGEGIVDGEDENQDRDGLREFG